MVLLQTLLLASNEKLQILLTKLVILKNVHVTVTFSMFLMSQFGVMLMMVSNISMSKVLLLFEDVLVFCWFSNSNF